MNTPASTATFAPPHMPEYDHTQWSPLPWLIVGPALAVLAVVYANVPDSEAGVFLPIVAAIVVAVAFSFRWLRIVDEGECLLLRFGSVPLFHKRFLYAEIVEVERDRSSILDGWGIHWVPRRGWTYNVWGRDCVRLTLVRERIVRIGTDDPEGLAQFLAQKASAAARHARP